MAMRSPFTYAARTAPPSCAFATAASASPRPTARVFEPFFRGSNAGATPGSGVGLAAARQIVEELGGTISLTSRNREGSEFTVTLPLDAPSAHPAAPR